ncbi:MAG TPA: Gldg family protein, partial [Vicinamibacterales bacterium]|nr:Gldg family protein [Vicinamibacterales bacterium]
ANDQPGYASVVEALKRDNYTVETLVLAQSEAGVPADASVLIIAGPKADYLKPEVDAIRTYLRKGGKALFMLDPPVGEAARPTPALEALLKEWGITLGHDVVIDISGMGQLLGTGPSVPVVASYPQHDVVQNFDLLTAFPLSQSVKGVAGTELGMALTENVINTSERSWSESDVKSLAAGGKVSLDEAAGDQRGPITIALSLAMDAPDAPAPAAAAAPEGKPADGAKPEDAPKKPQMRILVVGDSDFASNAAAGIQGNADLFVNMNNWLTQQEDLISIRARDAGDRRVTLTADQQRRLAWIALLFIPGLILGSGVYTWWQRR